MSRSVTPVSSVSSVSVGGFGGSRVGFGVGVSRGGVEGGLVCCLCDSDRKMGGGAAMAAPSGGRTRFMHVVPAEGCVPKVGFPVRPKICVLSQRWRQG